ncbi:50S ribosomal protein L9 [Chloroflexota bacterium]
MRVVFLQDVTSVANAGDIKAVADGYARNFLIPRKLAIIADSSAMSKAEEQIRKREKEQAKQQEGMVALAAQIEALEITVKARCGEQGRLYGAVTSADIAAEVQSSAGLDIDKRKIELAEPIHELGSYEVAVKLARDIVPKIKITVVAEEKS